MTTKKIPISFNEQDQQNIKELVELMGITGVYGDIPKAVKFGITLALSAIRNPEKVYNDLDMAEMETYFTSIRKSESIRKATQKIENIKKKAELV